MKLKKVFLYIVILLYTLNNLYTTEISSPTFYIKQDFDVLNYDATIEFSKIQRKLIFANNKITIHWLKRTPGSKFYFHLRSLSVDKVEYNGKMLDFLTVGTPLDSTYHFEITIPENDFADTATIQIYYHGLMQNEGGMNPWGGVHDKDAIFALGVGFYCNYVSTTQHWLACYDHPSDKATFKLTFINPINGFIISNGNYTKTTIDGKEAYIFSSNKPIATYLMTFADYNYKEHIIDYKIPIKIYADDKYSSSVPKVFSKLPQILDIYEEMFGDYPFEMLGYVITPIGSMESQMMINLDEAVFKNAVNKNDSLNLTIAHELAHQWFGNSVTPYDFRDAYLNESWATYSESLLLEKFFDISEYLKEQEKKLNSYINQIALYEGYLPLYDFPRKSSSSNYPGTIYNKGSVVLGMLRYLMTNGVDDNIFFDFVKDYLRTFRYKNVSTEEFKNLILKYYSDTISVNQFFDNWIYKIGYPKFDIQLVLNNNSNEGKYKDVGIKQNNPKSWGLFNQIPIPISFVKGNSNFDTVIWIKKNNLDYIYLSELIGNNKLLFDTLYFNKGNILRSLFTVNNIQVINNNNVRVDNFDISFNLSQNILSINVLNNIGPYYVMIYDIFGRLVTTHTNQTNKPINIDVNYLPSGFYNFVVSNNGNILFSNKFAIIR